jgi:hypothetical protein
VRDTEGSLHHDDEILVRAKIITAGVLHAEMGAIGSRSGGGFESYGDLDHLTWKYVRGEM